MNPDATQFKLVSTDQTRRVAFVSRPKWLSLADKIHSLFDIPLNRVAVSYLDAEDDEVVMSTEEELGDFYGDLDHGGRWRPGDVVKLTILDLGSMRKEKSEKSLPTTPRTSTNLRNTFGGSLSEGLPFNIDEDWQQFPPFGGVFMGNPRTQGQDSNLRAFIEVVESDASTARERPPSSSSSSVRTPTPRLDKGKGRAFDVEEDDDDELEYHELAADNDDDDVSSTVSMIASEGPDKQAIHILGRPASQGLFEPSKSKSSQPSRTSRTSRASHRSSVGPLPVESEGAQKSTARDMTPKSTTKDLTPKSAAKDLTSPALSYVSVPPSTIPVVPTLNPIASSTPNSIPPSEDPPLPALDKVSLDKFAKPSLSTDVADLLSMFSAVLGSHPEIADRVRDILQNAAAGAYWGTSSQRDSILSLQESVAELGSIDQEAGKKVAEALGSLFRTVGQAVGTSKDAKPKTALPDVNKDTPPAPVDTTANPPQPPPPSHPPMAYETFPRDIHGYWHPPPMMLPPTGLSDPQAPSRGLYPYHRGPERPPLHQPPLHQQSSRSLATGGTRSYKRAKQNSQDLRAQVEAAKLLYKAEKERYRADREERRKAKEERERKLLEMYRGRGDTSFDQQNADWSTSTEVAPPNPSTLKDIPSTAPTEPAQVISNGHGRYPSFEITRVPSAPHRSNTTGANTLRRVSDNIRSRRVSEQQSDPKDRSLKRIIKKLGDMGFTTRVNPDLPTRIEALLPSDITTMTIDKEEDITTTLVRELVKRPTATNTTGLPTVVPIVAGDSSMGSGTGISR